MSNVFSLMKSDGTVHIGTLSLNYLTKIRYKRAWQCHV